MTHKIYHSLIAALIGAATTGAVQAAPIPAMGLRFVAAEAGDSSISVRSARVLPHERSMIVSMCIRVDRDLKGTESIELRPVLTDSTGHSAVLPSIFINGRTQHIAFQRDRRNAKRDLVTLRRRNGMEQTIDYLREVAYQPWMRKATLVLEEVACGCGIPIAYDSHAVATLRSDDPAQRRHTATGFPHSRGGGGQDTTGIGTRLLGFPTRKVGNPRQLPKQRHRTSQDHAGHRPGEK